MTHLVDTSVWHKYGSFEGVRTTIDAMFEAGAIFSTCPPIIAEYCFSARDSKELKAMQEDLRQFYQVDSIALTDAVERIQRSLWGQGLKRAAGANDTLIAAYAVAADQVLVTCDTDFVHISRALQHSRSPMRLHVVCIDEAGLLI